MYHFRFTCNECVEGLQFVEAYMNDPLWVNEYTLYLELNFCASHQPPHCPDMVKRHFPAMHAMAMEEFFVPESLCICTLSVGEVLHPLILLTHNNLHL